MQREQRVGNEERPERGDRKRCSSHVEGGGTQKGWEGERLWGTGVEVTFASRYGDRRHMYEMGLTVPRVIEGHIRIDVQLQKQFRFGGSKTRQMQRRLLEDASKQGRKIADLDVDEEVTLIDETQERNDEEILFVTAAGEVVTTANVEVTTASAPTITIDELTLAQTLIEIKAAKPKAIITAATTTTRPKARGVVVQEPTMMDIGQQMQIEEQEQLSIEEKSKLFIELLEKRKKHFAALSSS
ncbi:hypothetical protein Tco_0966908 [Tanacetum coccineum]